MAEQKFYAICNNSDCYKETMSKEQINQAISDRIVEKGIPQEWQDIINGKATKNGTEVNLLAGGLGGGKWHTFMLNGNSSYVGTEAGGKEMWTVSLNNYSYIPFMIVSAYRAEYGSDEESTPTIKLLHTEDNDNQEHYLKYNEAKKERCIRIGEVYVENSCVKFDVESVSNNRVTPLELYIFMCANRDVNITVSQGEKITEPSLPVPAYDWESEVEATKQEVEATKQEVATLKNSLSWTKVFDNPDGIQNTESSKIRLDFDMPDFGSEMAIKISSIEVISNDKVKYLKATLIKTEEGTDITGGSYISREAVFSFNEYYVTISQIDRVSTGREDTILKFSSSAPTEIKDLITSIYIKQANFIDIASQTMTLEEPTQY